MNIKFFIKVKINLNLIILKFKNILIFLEWINKGEGQNTVGDMFCNAVRFLLY